MSGSADYAALKTFLADPARPTGTLRYHELQGFFFTIACCPDLVPPLEWMPVIFADREAGYRSLEEANGILGQLMSLHNEVVRLARGELARLPADCLVRDDALSNFAEDAPLAQWSRGFLEGHQWLEESWQPYLSSELEDEYAALLMTLTFFASSSLAEAYANEGHRDLAGLANTIRRLFADAAAEYAALGRSIQQALSESSTPLDDPPEETRARRNEPCPCGSGKKWKRCCGAVTN